MAGGRRKTERRGSLVDERANAQVRSRGLERRARGGVTGVASHLCKRRTQLVRLELRGCARAARGGARARKEERGGGGERGNGPALGRQTTFEARSHRLGEGAHVCTVSGCDCAKLAWSAKRACGPRSTQIDGPRAARSRGRLAQRARSGRSAHEPKLSCSGGGSLSLSLSLEYSFVALSERGSAAPSRRKPLCLSG